MTNPDDFCDDPSVVFEAACNLEGDERQAYLDRVCHGKPDLRATIESMIDAHANQGEFLANPTVDVQSCELASVGTMIGPYKLLQELGEGGMGVVFMAEQLRPVRRRVALKIVKQGMDTRQFIARFEAERNALAMMDHPNIARVLDAGATDNGRPYFVMELVKGVPITKFCDHNKLTARERLQLFIDVCHAVQHAHQKGIIHRDLKPSNVLVALYDDRPVPKIIDFGVAKATNQRLTEKTLFTQVGQIVGTLEYMSPEQAVLNQLDVDTRADIYSLGVILYELLTGVTPIERDRLSSAGLEEMLRLIRDEEPPKPSARVSTLGDVARSLATYRSTNVDSLVQVLHGDLDWIVMKALEKKRERRYETTNAFAADLNRYLQDEPVDARPPSAAYRLRKFARRNRALVTTAAAITLVLVLGLIGTASGWISQSIVAEDLNRALQELNDKSERLRAAVNSLQDELINRALNEAVTGDYARAMEAIDKARTAEASPDLLQTLEVLALFNSGRLEEAIENTQAIVNKDPDNASAWYILVMALDRHGQYGRSGTVGRDMEKHSVQPRTDYDRLLYAQLCGVGEPKKEMINQLNGLIWNRPIWAAAYAVRCKVWADLLLETKNAVDMQRMIDDAKIAVALMPNSPMALANGLIAFVRAIELEESHGHDTTQLRSHAADLAKRLDEWPTYALGREVRATYFSLIGRTDLVAEEEALLREQSAGGYFSEAVYLLEQGRTDSLQRLRERLEKENSVESQLFLPVLLALSPDDNVRQTALEIWRDRDWNNLAYVSVNVMLDVPLLLGRPDLAEQASVDLLKRRRPPVDWDGWQWRVEYLAGRETEQSYLARARPFSCCKAFADYTVGLQALARGEMEKARKHFEIVIQTGKVSWWSYGTARAILVSMDSDPNWGQWLVHPK